MTAPGLEIQTLLYQTLTGHPPLMALVDGVYDRIPDSPFGAKQAYVSFGASDMNPMDPEGLVMEERSVQIDVWSRKVGFPECHKICAEVKAALHLNEDIQLTDNALVEIQLEFERVFRDPDGLTSHGVLQFRIDIEVPE